MSSIINGLKKGRDGKKLELLIKNVIFVLFTFKSEVDDVHEDKPVIAGDRDCDSEKKIILYCTPLLTNPKCHLKKAVQMWLNKQIFFD